MHSVLLGEKLVVTVTENWQGTISLCWGKYCKLLYYIDVILSRSHHYMSYNWKPIIKYWLNAFRWDWMPIIHKGGGWFLLDMKHNHVLLSFDWKGEGFQDKLSVSNKANCISLFSTKYSFEKKSVADLLFNRKQIFTFMKAFRGLHYCKYNFTYLVCGSLFYKAYHVI